MNRLLIVTILIISTAPLFAQAQQPNAAKLKADAQKVVSIISGDNAKAQAYCQISKVGEQMNQALQAKDKNKVEKLAQKQSELEKNLGPEYLGLVDSLGKVNLAPKDGVEIVSMFDRLNDSCPDKQLASRASPMKCGKNIVVACWANDRWTREAGSSEALSPSDGAQKVVTYVLVERHEATALAREA